MPDSTAAIRSWAKNNGHHVAERGRLSVEVREAYAKAQKSNRPSKAPASKSNAPAKPRQAPSKRAASKPTAAILDVPTPVKGPSRASKAPTSKKNAPAKPRPVTPKRAAAKPTAAILDVPTPVTTPTRALSEPVAETSVTDPLAVRVATLEQQLKELTSRLAEVETKKRPLGRRRSA
jgi:hypothetical protein